MKITGIVNEKITHTPKTKALWESKDQVINFKKSNSIQLWKLRLICQPTAVYEWLSESAVTLAVSNTDMWSSH